MATLKEAIEFAKNNPTSTFATTLRQKIESGEADDKIKAEGITIPGYTPKQSFLDKVGTEASRINTQYRQNKTEAEVRQARGEQTGLETAAQTFGEAARAGVSTVLSPLTVGVGEVLNATGLTKGIEERAKATEAYIAEQKAINPNYDPRTDTKLNPFTAGQVQAARDMGMPEYTPSEREKANLGIATNLGGAAVDVAGALEGAGALKALAGSTAKGVASGVKQTATAIANAPIVSGTGEVLKSAGRTLKTIPENIATNVGEMQAKEALIKSIPSVTGQKAARSGVDVTDITTLKEVVNTPEANTLYNAVKDFAAGTSKVDPIEVVGRPITQKIKILNTQLSTLGKKLGAEANKLGTLDNEAVQKAVLKRLQGVSGLKGLKVADDGALDFTETTLKSSFTEADRKAIETAYKEAVNSGSGKQAHLYRQELFEVLDGKKRSLANITDTQDKALNAIRAGLSDVLEVNNRVYKTLSNEYRQTIQPLSELRKLSKTLDPNNPQDILDLSAGLLARRLTSAGASNPQVRMVLAGLDKATKVPGKTLGDTQKMQDLYNVLNKYYDIAPKTGFQNLVKEGTSGATGLVDRSMEAIKGFAGGTNATRQKALENYLGELLTKTSKTKNKPNK